MKRAKIKKKDKKRNKKEGTDTDAGQDFQTEKKGVSS